MRTSIVIIACILGFLLFFNGCIVNIVGDSTATAVGAQNLVPLPTDPSILKLVSLALLGIYEVVVRIVPSVGDYSAVSWVIRFLKKISDTLNVTK